MDRGLPFPSRTLSPGTPTGTIAPPPLSSYSRAGGAGRRLQVRWPSRTLGSEEGSSALVAHYSKRGVEIEIAILWPPSENRVQNEKVKIDLLLHASSRIIDLGEPIVGNSWRSLLGNKKWSGNKKLNSRVTAWVGAHHNSILGSSDFVPGWAGTRKAGRVTSFRPYYSGSCFPHELQGGRDSIVLGGRT
ncbi:hypothetical protein SUGI_1228150 [Cryptomeria japonica]|uniref:Uncharacterized protein n=1 Tax=Cryptomeria japonica TaxID=3369 RepID=A0AAD3NRN1_CRYJA|nr:hypothetical protein SUGI_1228150 [Cryptomeria japonica]